MIISLPSLTTTFLDLLTGILEFYQKASDNLKNAIMLRKQKDNKTFFYRQLQNLNEKIVLFKNMQKRYKSESSTELETQKSKSK